MKQQNSSKMVKTYEIKENPFSSRKVGCSDDFQKVLEIAINNVLSEKKQKNITRKSNEDAKRQFPAYFRPEKFFHKNQTLSCFGHS